MSYSTLMSPSEIIFCNFPVIISDFVQERLRHADSICECGEAVSAFSPPVNTPLGLEQNKKKREEGERRRWRRRWVDGCENE